MKDVISKLMERIRDVDFDFQATSEKRKDKRAQIWRGIKLKLKKIPFVASLVKIRNNIRRKIKASKFYLSMSEKMEKILTPEMRRKLWSIKRSPLYKFVPYITVVAAACFTALLIMNKGLDSSECKAAVEQTKEKKVASTKKVVTEKPTLEPTKAPEPTEEPKETATPDYEPFVPTEDNTKWLEGANKNVFADKNYKNVKGYKFYFNKGKVASTLGIDVSAHQGYIDWKKVAKTGVKFAMIRVGVRGHKTGKVQIDQYFKYNIENAQKNGIKVGVYFFTQAITTKEALEEANIVLNCIKGYKLDMPVVYDMEYVGYVTSRTKLANLTNEQRTDIAIAFLEKVKKAGYIPMFYANKNWLEQAIQLSRLNNYFIWFARYNDVPDYAYRYHMWQYTEKGKISGINGVVDINVCLVDFSKYIKNGTKVNKGDKTTAKANSTNVGTNAATTNTTTANTMTNTLNNTKLPANTVTNNNNTPTSNVDATKNEISGTNNNVAIGGDTDTTDNNSNAADSNGEVLDNGTDTMNGN